MTENEKFSDLTDLRKEFPTAPRSSAIPAGFKEGDVFVNAAGEAMEVIELHALMVEKGSEALKSGPSIGFYAIPVEGK